MEEVCADAGPDCFSKASTCGELMKPNAEYSKIFREAFVTCNKNSNDSSEEESHESAGKSQRISERLGKGDCKYAVQLPDSLWEPCYFLIFPLQNILMRKNSPNTRSASWKKQDS